MPRAAQAAPLDDAILVMDVVDTLRHGIDSPMDLRTAEGRAALFDRLRSIYLQHGLVLPEAVLRDGVAAMAEGRFVYPNPRPAFPALLARLYVSRTAWGPPVVAVFIALVVGFGAYFFGYRPYRESQAEQAQLELTRDLPAQMDAIYQTIFNETKVQSAAGDADQLRMRGKDAAQHGDRLAAVQAIADLTALREKLEQVYTLKVVDRDGVKPGFWSFPPNNSEATNYYLVVEALDADGKSLSLPITSEATGATQTVTQWGLRVPEAVYQAVMADKQDDGTIEHNLVGFKQDGFTDVDYLLPVLGGAVTQ